jgi:hypothetical protein
MRANSQNEIVINGVRYHIAIRLDKHWSYIAEWWIRSDSHKHGLDQGGRTNSEAEREATQQIHNAHLKQEPWLYAEIACADRHDGDPEMGME